jgi:hypothetical protein
MHYRCSALRFLTWINASVANLLLELRAAPAMARLFPQEDLGHQKFGGLLFNSGEPVSEAQGPVS